MTAPTEAQVLAAERFAQRMKREAEVRHKERQRAFDILDIQVRHDNPIAAVALYEAAAKIMGEKP